MKYFYTISVVLKQKRWWHKEYWQDHTSNTKKNHLQNYTLVIEINVMTLFNSFPWNKQLFPPIFSFLSNGNKKFVSILIRNRYESIQTQRSSSYLTMTFTFWLGIERICTKQHIWTLDVQLNHFWTRKSIQSKKCEKLRRT